MVVYKFEMVYCFLENKVFSYHPEKNVILAIVHCLAIFALKLILKTVQKTNVSKDYVKFMVREGNGKEAMLLASKVAGKVFNGEPVDFLFQVDHENESDAGIGIYIFHSSALPRGNKYLFGKIQFMVIILKIWPKIC